MPELTIKLEGAEAIQELLTGMARRGENLTPIMRAIGDRVTEQTKRRIEAGGPAPDGTPWARPKSDNPRRRGTLHVSGHLKDSIRNQLQGSAAVVIGTNKIYGAIHQLGGTTRPHTIVPRRAQALATPYGIFKKVRHPGSTIPARPYLGLSRGDREEILGIMNEYILGRG